MLATPNPAKALTWCISVWNSYGSPRQARRLSECVERNPARFFFTFHNLVANGKPVSSLVFVHGYGGNPETTWHDESTGKIWIKDEEFITRIKRPVRIFSFSYNGDVEANLSSSSPAFHASDLLCCLEQALERSAVR